MIKWNSRIVGVVVLVGALITAILLATVSPRPALAEPGVLGAGDHDIELPVGGMARRALVHVPEKLEEHPALMLVLHGGGGNADQAVRMTGMNAVADRNGFVVAYPQGTCPLKNKLCTWNSGNCCGQALDNKVDDVAFIGALLDHLLSARPYDIKRVYVTGISNGGMMSYRLACELSDRITAAAPVAGAMNLECRPARAVSILAIHGTADRHVRYEGGEPLSKIDPHHRVDAGVATAKTFWTTFDRCPSTPETETKGVLEIERFPNCGDDTAVSVVTIRGGGHVWPGGASHAFSGDKPVRELSASDAIWEFFKDKHR